MTATTTNSPFQKTYARFGWQLIGTLLVIFMSSTSQAAIYECLGPDGKQTFSDLPCPAQSGKASVVAGPVAAMATPTSSSVEVYKKTAEKLRLEQKAEEDAYLAAFDAAVGPECIKLFRALSPMGTIYYEQDKSTAKAQFVERGCPAKVVAIKNEYYKKSEATKLRHAAVLEKLKPNSVLAESEIETLKKKREALEREQETLTTASLNRSGENPQCIQLERKLEQTRKENKESPDLVALQDQYKQLNCDVQSRAIFAERRKKEEANYAARSALSKEMRVVQQMVPARTAQTEQCKKAADRMAEIFLNGLQSDSHIREYELATKLIETQKCDPNLFGQAIASRQAAISFKIDSTTDNPCEAKGNLQSDLRRLKTHASTYKPSASAEREMIDLQSRISTLSKRCP